MDNRATQRITTIILLIGEASGIFAGFCPSWFTVASPFFHEQEAKSGNIARIRAGEVAATAIVLATGAAVSVALEDPVPFWSAVAISGVFVAGYEYQIRNPSTDSGGSKSQETIWNRLTKKA